MAALQRPLQFDHSYPCLDSNNTKHHFNSGLLMYTPSVELFQHHIELINKSDLLYPVIPEDSRGSRGLQLIHHVQSSQSYSC